jgi:voltage-gated potassium channel
MTTPSADTAPRSEPFRAPDADDPTGRLGAYMARTSTPLDLLALLTLWIVLVPPSDFGSTHHGSTFAATMRVALSVVYGIDLAIRAHLARRHWHYIRTHPLSLVVVVFPPVRVIFSFRLVKSVFLRGSLRRFLLAATVLALNFAIVVDLYERHAKGSNIHSLGESIWWAITTVTTVGYGDYFPVTTGGKIAATLIMAIGILTIAVITAQVASSFVDQAARTRAGSNGAGADAEPAPAPATESGPGADTPDVSMADIARRLERIEVLLAARYGGPDATE